MLSFGAGGQTVNPGAAQLINSSAPVLPFKISIYILLFPSEKGNMFSSISSVSLMSLKIHVAVKRILLSTINKLLLTKHVSCRYGWRRRGDCKQPLFWRVEKQDGDLVLIKTQQKQFSFLFPEMLTPPQSSPLGSDTFPALVLTAEEI